MPETSLRCIAGAAILSAAVGGLAYAQAQQTFDRREDAFRQIAQEECLANDPGPLMRFEPKTVDEANDKLRRLTALHKICAFSLGDEAS